MRDAVVPPDCFGCFHGQCECPHQRRVEREVGEYQLWPGRGRRVERRFQLRPDAIPGPGHATAYGDPDWINTDSEVHYVEGQLGGELVRDSGEPGIGAG